MKFILFFFLLACSAQAQFYTSSSSPSDLTAPGPIGATTQSSGAFTTLSGSTSLTIGGGTAVAKILSASAALDWPSIAGLSESTLTITVSGATTTNTPTVGLGFSAALEASIAVKQAWVSGANTVSITLRNLNAAVAVDPASLTVRATVISY